MLLPYKKYLSFLIVFFILITNANPCFAMDTGTNQRDEIVDLNKKIIDPLITSLNNKELKQSIYKVQINALVQLFKLIDETNDPNIPKFYRDQFIKSVNEKDTDFVIRYLRTISMLANPQLIFKRDKEIIQNLRTIFYSQPAENPLPNSPNMTPNQQNPHILIPLDENVINFLIGQATEQDTNYLELLIDFLLKCKGKIYAKNGPETLEWNESHFSPLLEKIKGNDIQYCITFLNQFDRKNSELSIQSTNLQQLTDLLNSIRSSSEQQPQSLNNKINGLLPPTREVVFEAQPTITPQQNAETRQLLHVHRELPINQQDKEILSIKETPTKRIHRSLLLKEIEILTDHKNTFWLDGLKTILRENKGIVEIDEKISCNPDQEDLIDQLKKTGCVVWLTMNEEGKSNFKNWKGRFDTQFKKELSNNSPSTTRIATSNALNTGNRPSIILSPAQSPSAHESIQSIALGNSESQRPEAPSIQSNQLNLRLTQNRHEQAMIEQPQNKPKSAKRRHQTENKSKNKTTTKYLDKELIDQFSNEIQEKNFNNFQRFITYITKKQSAIHSGKKKTGLKKTWDQENILTLKQKIQSQDTDYCLDFLKNLKIEQSDVWLEMKSTNDYDAVSHWMNKNFPKKSRTTFDVTNKTMSTDRPNEEEEKEEELAPKRKKGNTTPIEID